MYPLELILAARIASEGPLDVGTFMELALGHPEHGYYRTRDPLGRGGDFTTAPEISQIFGELIGLWAADLWRQMGSPKKLILLECGPGRGTLMADALRAAKNAKGFLEAAEIHLLETSPVLRQLQKQTLSEYTMYFHEKLPPDTGGIPLIMIGNEFLDALPVRQLIRRGQAWAERAIICAPTHGFTFSEKPFEGKIDDHDVFQVEEGEIVEISPAQNTFILQTLKLLKAGGAALFIDYGHIKSAPGDTLQAVRDHKYAEILKDIGEADLTAHVDFERLSQVARKAGAWVYGPVTQSHFLLSLGLAQRAETLIRALETTRSPSAESSLKEMKSAVLRLSGPAVMGQLFKAICITHDRTLRPAGF
ncbi:MAG: SAM-dependent methyltransferase [Alphaproteobacteria bacterium]|nr:SAM-dependent methyltransferase [Alphaproteobacteria bacterium]MBP7758924.1 SAM-dependent methyltransferase [Alphaproteobacteria bacterium]MBP7762199.1 SAM-dependent methyltransferase [Alphaproteobacteria bacterium]MBP7905804.1 SAM-dependent methyltransferase [Alphaproteobacteria bacterium]